MKECFENLRKAVNCAITDAITNPASALELKALYDLVLVLGPKEAQNPNIYEEVLMRD